MYHNRGLPVRTLHADLQFECLEESLLTLPTGPVQLATVGQRTHCARAERAIRTVKEPNRSIVDLLPYKRYPRVIKKTMVEYAALQCCLFPQKDSVSDVYSPHTLVTGVRLDATKHARVNFGSYCEVHDEPDPSNTEQRRTTGAIALGPHNRITGSYLFFSLDTGNTLVRDVWTEMDITPEVVDRVHYFADKENDPDRFADVDPLDFEWTPGVPVRDEFPPNDQIPAIDGGAQDPEPQNEDQNEVNNEDQNEVTIENN